MSQTLCSLAGSEELEGGGGAGVVINGLSLQCSRGTKSLRMSHCTYGPLCVCVCVRERERERERVREREREGGRETERDKERERESIKATLSKGSINMVSRARRHG